MRVSEAVLLHSASHFCQAVVMQPESLGGCVRLS